MASSRSAALVPVEHIARSIRILRGRKVLLDAELAALYGVTTKRFNEQVRRNRERFPSDSMFQLTDEERAALRSQFATLKLSFVAGHPFPRVSVEIQVGTQVLPPSAEMAQSWWQDFEVISDQTFRTSTVFPSISRRKTKVPTPSLNSPTIG